MDRFTAQGGPGLLLLHAAGNVFVRELVEGQTLLVKPTALIFKDRTVKMDLEISSPIGSWITSHRMIWLRLYGHGRVAVQSAYEPMEDAGRTVSGQSPRLYFKASQQAGPSNAPSGHSPTSGQTLLPTHIDARRMAIMPLVTEAIAGHAVVSEETMAGLIEAGTQHGLSAYDVRMLVKHVQARRGW